MSNVYDFRPGRSLANVNPQEVGEWLDSLREKHGTLTPEIVRDESKDESSPAHAAFEWDNDAAADKYRLLQARKIIVSIRVLNSPAAQPTTAYISVRTPDKGRSYVPVVEAMSDEQLRTRVLAEARQAVESLERRYRHYEGIADLFERLKQAVG